MWNRVLVCRFLVSILPLCAAAQYSNRNPVGGNSIEVRFMIVLEGQKEPYSKQVTVSVMDGWGNTETVEDTTSGFVDILLPEGIHRLRVVGPEIESYLDEFYAQRDGQTVHTIEVRPRRFQLGAKDKDNPRGPAAVVRLSVPPQAQKEFDKARESWKKKKVDETEGHLRKAIALYPKYDEAYAALGELELSKGDAARGRADLQSALQLNANNVAAARHLAEMYVAGADYASAEPLLRTVLRAEPGNQWALVYAAWGELVLGKLADAIANAQKVLTLPHKGFEASYLIAARGLEMSGRFDEARNACHAYLAELPGGKDAAEAHRILARIDTESPPAKP